MRLAEGMGSRHRGMPQIQFSSEEVAYLGNITGIAPTERIVVEPDNADQRDPP